MSKAYDYFRKLSQELANLHGISQTLRWDQETMMPPQGASFRARQISTLATLHHDKLTDPKLDQILKQLEATKLELWDRASVREMLRRCQKATRVPRILVRELAETTSLAYQAWVRARQESNLSIFAPWLRKIIQLKQQEARCLQSSNSLYEALLDEYEPEMKTSQLNRLFTDLRPRLTSLFKEIDSSSHQSNPHRLEGNYPTSQQQAFGYKVLTAIGFDWTAGRLDVSPHPFCSTLSPGDVRMTTRYNESNFCSSFFGMIHEAGHGLYEQGLNSKYFGLPACESISLGIHESQSRLWENQVSRSREFWEYWLPRFRRSFPGQLEKMSLDDFVHAINSVQSSFIRVEADEVTYGLHVILRYELEKSLIEGELAVNDLEEAWNDKMEEYLGIVPSRASDGFLQDTHWSQGLIGYFPTYLLGTLYAAQIFAQARKDISDLKGHIRRGNLVPLREWLKKNIHVRGKTVTAVKLIEEISGEPLRAIYFLSYLEEKFGKLYRL